MLFSLTCLLVVGDDDDSVDSSLDTRGVLRTTGATVAFIRSSKVGCVP